MGEIKVNELFNSSFELSLRVLIILNVAHARLSIDRIVAFDFISTYGCDFGISESNLHGNNDYRFSEYATKRIIITQSIKNLVLEGFVLPYCNKGGFSYSISPTGKKFCSSLNDDYANDFTQIVQQTVDVFSNYSDRALIQTINSHALKMFGGK